MRCAVDRSDGLAPAGQYPFCARLAPENHGEGVEGVLAPKPPIAGAGHLRTYLLRVRIAVMSSKTLDEHIELTSDTAGGRPRIRGRRITVQDIAIWHERLGKSADEIATEYDLTLGDVYAALAYYFDHREEIDARLTEDGAFAEALRARTPSKRFQKLSSLGGEN